MNIRNGAAERVISMIFKLFKVSNDEKPVHKVRLQQSYCLNKLDCSIAFSIESDDYYFRSCSDPYHPYTSEELLRCGKKKVKGIPLTINRMLDFETTLFPEEIVNIVYKVLKDNLPNCYQIKQFDKGLEVILLTQ